MLDLKKSLRRRRELTGPPPGFSSCWQSVVFVKRKHLRLTQYELGTRC